MFEISLTAQANNADATLKNFVAAMPQFDIVEHKKRNISNNGTCYIYLKLTPRPAKKGGRPQKLSTEQIAEIKNALQSENCNKSQLARKYGVAYATINKLSKTIF